MRRPHHMVICKQTCKSTRLQTQGNAPDLDVLYMRIMQKEFNSTYIRRLRVAIEVRSAVHVTYDVRTYSLDNDTLQPSKLYSYIRIQ